MDKKEILKALGEHFEVKPKYLGAPSFAYQIETYQGESYLVDREGKIRNSSGTELELESILKGLVVEIKEEENLSREAILTMNGHTGSSLRNLVNMISSKQGLIKKALGTQEDIVTQEFVEEINSIRLTTLEDFEAEALRIGLEKARGLGFDFNKKSISFQFLNGLEDENVKRQFAEALSKGAIKLKYTSYKEKKTDNEKYTMRTWLLRLGFIGDRYKEARNQLLSNLGGNSAFRKQVNE